jgi:NAD(P)-dependent dehydrogenase (short-subunit alcohol dehydrogenase family)
MDIKSKKALVFGGTSGIGLAAVQQLSELGAEVIAVGRNPDKVTNLPANTTVMKCDVLDKEALQALFLEIGAIDILVSAATGGGRAVGPFMDMDMDGYQASFAKLWGYTNVVRYGVDQLSDSGAVVLVSGTPARYCNPGQIAISSVGGAVEAFVRGVAKEIMPKRINTVSPGVIDTPMVALTGEERDAHYERVTAKNLIPRAGTADEVATGIIFAIQNDFVTGSTIDVDGGLFLS